ncbi:MAG: hypothetical protein GYA17_06340 [Chloroflexi bacterium]|nr:cytochrome c3 family protein [Anaerolineaceae bacterium]NMB87958.1 hypothetical protein [Chloroflexota bacterium]
MRAYLPIITRGLGLAALVLAVLLLGILTGPSSAVQAGTGGAPDPQNEPPPNAECLACHSQAGQYVTLSSGELLLVSIAPQVYGGSVHGQQNMNCTDCHTDISGYPHPEKPVDSLRDYTLFYKDACADCHQEQYQQVQDSIHTREFNAGNVNAPVCSDCHDPHAQGQIRDEQGHMYLHERANIPQTCAQCHNEIFEVYAQSVHGSGILDNNNPDVATCTDCHGVHQIQDPTSETFRLSSVDVCANCHTNPNIMDKYGLSTAVLDTYVSDFHGTTVTLFEPTHPDAGVNEPVCFDCHGIHDIQRVDDPVKGIEVKQNMLATCQRCHPDATENFPDSWLSHYIPSPERAPLVYYVNLFYKFFIPGVLGAMAVFVVSDVRHRAASSRRRAPEKDATPEPAPPADEPPAAPETDDDPSTPGEGQS